MGAPIPPKFQLPALHKRFSLDERDSLQLRFVGMSFGPCGPNHTSIRYYLSHWMAKAALRMTSQESNISFEEQSLNLLSQSRLLGLSSLVGFLKWWQLLAVRAPDASRLWHHMHFCCGIEYLLLLWEFGSHSHSRPYRQMTTRVIQKK